MERPPAAWRRRGDGSRRGPVPGPAGTTTATIACPHSASGTAVIPTSDTPGARAQRVLDGERCDVDAAADQHVVGTAGHGDLPLPVDRAGVAGGERALAGDGAERRTERHAQVAGRDERPADAQPAGVQVDGDAGQWLPVVHAAATGLGHSVAAHQPDPVRGRLARSAAGNAAPPTSTAPNRWRAATPTGSISRRCSWVGTTETAAPRGTVAAVAANRSAVKGREVSRAPRLASRQGGPDQHHQPADAGGRQREQPVAGGAERGFAGRGGVPDRGRGEQRVPGGTGRAGRRDGEGDVAVDHALPERGRRNPGSHRAQRGSGAVERGQQRR